MARLRGHGAFSQPHLASRLFPESGFHAYRTLKVFEYLPLPIILMHFARKKRQWRSGRHAG
jgi:hypothetical protein